MKTLFTLLFSIFLFNDYLNISSQVLRFTYLIGNNIVSTRILLRVSLNYLQEGGIKYLKMIKNVESSAQRTF